MRLLVSVRTAGEAATALAGGADIVDAKEPAAGALGAVQPEVLRAIVSAVAGRRMVTAALGDAGDEQAVAAAAAMAAASGAALVKIGFSQTSSLPRAARLLGAVVDGARPAGTVAVAYADHAAVGSLSPGDIIEAAVRAGATGLLVDTADKRGPGLRALVDTHTLGRWVDAAHTAGLLVALAGQVTIDDLPWLQGLEADVVGVRGAACDGGRQGAISTARVQALAGVLKSTASSVRSVRV